MDEHRESITEEFSTKKKTVPARQVFRVVWRVVALLLTAALVVGAVYVVVHRNEFTVERLRRQITSRTRRSDVSEPFTFSGDTDSAFAVVDDTLIVCSTGELQVFDQIGEKLLEQPVRMEQPVISAAGSYALAYDSNGAQLFVLRNAVVTQRYTATGEQGILSARINTSGWTAVVEQATGYKAAVTVYDTSFQPRLTENISSSYIMDAALSDDNATLALVSIGEDATGFQTVLIFYNVSDGMEIGRYVLGSDVVLDLRWRSDTLWVQGEYGAYCVADHQLKASYTDAARFLQQFSLGGEGFASLYFCKYQGGTTGSLTLLEADGTQNSVGINEEVLSVSAAGGYVAVLTGSQLTIYNRDLTVFAATESGGARRVQMRGDGTAVLISGNSATLFQPD